MTKPKKIILTALSIVILSVIAVVLLNWFSRPKIKEWVTESPCTDESDCVVRLNKACGWEVLSQETAAQRDAQRQKPDPTIPEIDVVCGGPVPIGSSCREGFCVVRMQQGDFQY